MHPKKIDGLRVPLFDRLVDCTPEARKELTPLRVHDRDALFSSIARDLQRLLNTRRASDVPLDVTNATVLDYGIPPFSKFSASSVTDRSQLAEILRCAITAFEPRLQEISIQIESSDSSPHQMVGSISCKAKLENLLEPMTFPILLHGSEKSIEVLAVKDCPLSGTATRPVALELSNG